jgi:hypothetical protein
MIDPVSCVDVEIVDAVLALNTAGAITFESCQGDLEDQSPQETHTAYIVFENYKTVPATFIEVMKACSAVHMQLRYLESGLDDTYFACDHSRSAQEIIAANVLFREALRNWFLNA